MDNLGTWHRYHGNNCEHRILSDWKMEWLQESPWVSMVKMWLTAAISKGTSEIKPNKLKLVYSDVRGSMKSHSIGKNDIYWP